MQTQELTGTDLELIAELDFEPDIPCDSLVEAHAGVLPHPAEWFILFSCGCPGLACEKSRQRAIRFIEGDYTTVCECGAVCPTIVSITPLGA